MEPTATEPTAPIRTVPTATTPTATEPTAEAGFPGLAELIGPGAVAGFLRDSLGISAYRTGIDRAAARRLFGWPQLNATLAEHRLAPPRLRLERAGSDVSRPVFRSRRTRRGTVMQDLDTEALNAALRDGATLIVDAVNELSPPLEALCSRLAAEFLASCQTNLYACWGRTQGFDVHWDDHDVFVIQVEGRKRWALYGSNLAHPTRAGPPCEHPRPERPVEELVLAAGDVLYLPRGHWHAAVGLGEPSLHLTIGLTRKTGADALRWLADQALAQAGVRADLPFEHGDAAVASRLREVLAHLAGLDPDELARRYRRHVAATQVFRPRLSFPHIGAPDGRISGEATLRLASGAASVWRDGAEAVLSWRGVEFKVDGGLEAPLRRLARGETITVQALGDALSSDQQAQVAGFAAEMVARGVFVLAAAEP